MYYNIRRCERGVYAMTLDEQYEEWMFERFIGVCSKDKIKQ